MPEFGRFLLLFPNSPCTTSNPALWRLVQERGESEGGQPWVLSVP